MYLRTIAVGFIAFFCAASTGPGLFAQQLPPAQPNGYPFGGPVAPAYNPPIQPPPFPSIAEASSEPAIAPPTSREREERIARIDALVAQLGGSRFADREDAQRELAELGGLARSALERAAKGDDAEVVHRARRLLSVLPALTHTVVDAFGAPIPWALVTVKIVRPEGSALNVERTLQGESDDQGRIGVPQFPSSDHRAIVELTHPDYGGGRYEVTTFTRETELRFPLVRADTEARARAVEGIVVDEAGQPIAGANVRGQNVRTPGQGLVNGSGNYGEALTDAAGRFVFYLPNEDRRGERGELIPVNSTYQLTISVAGDESFFPLAESYSNLATNTITLHRATQFHRFRFEAAGGGWINDPKLLPYLSIQYDGDPANNQPRVTLDRTAVTEGRLLLPGVYIGEGFFNGSQVKYEPIVVTADSPQVLDFKLPPPKVFRGRVLHGVTGQPLAGALVMGYSSVSRNNLALLPPEAWRELQAAVDRGVFDSQTAALMRPFYGMQGLVRAGEDGRFEISQDPDREFYGLIAMDENFVPFKVRIFSLKTDEDGPIAAGDFFLFPAAKVVVRPVFAGDRLPVAPKWLLEETGQPDWFGRYQAATDGQNREFEYVHWLEINDSQPLFVPAGVRLRLMLESPYDDAWAPAVIEPPLQLEPGQTREIGDVHFAAALPAVVRVVDQAGRPLEGIPVRRRSGNIGSVAHNTDAAGEASFFVNPQSRGQFYVSNLPGPRERSTAANLFAPFEIDQEAPSEPFVITLTEEQQRLLLETTNPMR